MPKRELGHVWGCAVAPVGIVFASCVNCFYYSSNASELHLYLVHYLFRTLDMFCARSRPTNVRRMVRRMPISFGCHF